MQSDRFEQRKRFLLAELRPGYSNRIGSIELSERIGIRQIDVPRVVSALRRDGHPIGSMQGEGYYLIQTDDELRSTIAHIAARKRGIDETIACLQASVAREQRAELGQLTLSEVAA